MMSLQYPAQPTRSDSCCSSPSWWAVVAKRSSAWAASQAPSPDSATTGDALAGAQIRCENTTSGEPAGSITDASGRFIIEITNTGEVP